MYYIEQQKKLKKNLKRFALLLSDDLESSFGTEKTKQILQETQDEFDILILQLPYIGGKSNPLTRNLIEAGYSLAFYRALKKQGVSLEEAGELIHLGTTYKLNKIPAFMRQLLGRWKLAKWQIPKLKKLAEISRERRYPEDWVFEMIEGDGQSFDIGRNYLECGIEKFMRRQGAEELTPYLCETDYIVFYAFDMELIRTKTLAFGCDCCDFRMKKSNQTPPVWPPRFIERRCGKTEMELNVH